MKGDLNKMHLNKWTKYLVSVAVLFVGTLACSSSEIFVAQATVTRTRTPRPTFTPMPDMTDTPVPTIAPTRAPTLVLTATKPPTARPPTARPATAVPKSSAPSVALPTVSSMDFHVNPPTCAHSGKTYIKGIVYLDKNDPSQRYAQAIVVLGSPDGKTRYADPILSEWDGTYTFILNDNGPRPGSWGVWLATASLVRKSDIGGPINTNSLGPDDPKACWAGSVDFWR